MKHAQLKIKTKNKTYNLIIGSNLLINLNKILKNNLISFEKCLLVIDNKVPKKFVKKINKNFKKKINYLFNPSEKNKNNKSIDKLLHLLSKNNFSRNDCIISIGGGITGDVSGFAASIFKRGMKFINIPTTLLSQVDSSIGGKTGINSAYGKNSIGTFYQPDLVISDTKFLKSLPKREIICGYAEILKHSLIMSEKLFRYLDKNGNYILQLKKPFIENAIYKSCLIKKKIIEKDENEKNLRKVLNFGHTFAHTFEATNNYAKNLNHGEAVLLGMLCALNFSKKTKKINEKNYQKIIDHYKKNKLPMNLKKYFYKNKVNRLLSFMQKDKKNNNSKKINLILLNKIGKVKYNYEFKKNLIHKFLTQELIKT